MNQVPFQLALQMLPTKLAQGYARERFGRLSREICIEEPALAMMSLANELDSQVIYLDLLEKQAVLRHVREPVEKAVMGVFMPEFLQKAVAPFTVCLLRSRIHGRPTVLVGHSGSEQHLDIMTGELETLTTPPGSVHSFDVFALLAESLATARLLEPQ